MNEDFRPITIEDEGEVCAICTKTFEVGDAVRRGVGRDRVCNNETCTAKYETAYNEWSTHDSEEELEAQLREIFHQ